jgi:hypothetical protein
MARKRIVEDEQIDEFVSSSGNGVLPSPATTGSAARSADKSAGESEYSMTTKAEVLAALMHDLQARGKDELFDIYHAHTNANNARGADKSGGETLDTVKISPTGAQAMGAHNYQVTTPRTAHEGPFAGQATVKLPINAKEDVSEIFGSDALSEELMTKASTVYEAAVNSRISIIETRLQEQYTEALNEAIDLVSEEMVESVDKYLSYVANKWIEENQLAVDNNLKAEMAEEFLLGLKDIFESNYITVSDDREDVLSSMAEEIDLLKSRLNEEVEKNFELSEKVEEAQIADLVAEHAEGMSTVQREKFFSLVENISYNNVNELDEKIETIKETYFSEKSATRSAAAEPLTEGYELEDTEEKTVPSNMRAYADVISRTVKK